MSYDIERTEKGGVPTLANVIRDAGRYGADRVVVVRPQTELFAAVAVLMLSHAAARELGPFMVETVRRLAGADKPWNWRAIGMDESLGKLFRSMDEEGEEFTWAWLGQDMLMVCFRGPVVTDEFAAGLCARGCPCKLQ